MERRGGTAYKQLCYKPHTVLTYNHFIQFFYTASEYMALYKCAVHRNCMKGCMTERKGCEEGAIERRGGCVKKGGSVKIRESVIKVESEEKVWGGGSVERRGVTAYTVSSSVINQHTVFTYSHFIQFFYTASEYMV
jgi:hypothetical protein